MKKNKRIKGNSIINELKIWKQMFLNPDYIIEQLRKKNNISFEMCMRVMSTYLLFMVIIPSSGTNMIRGVGGVSISVLLLSVYLYLIATWSEGKVTMSNIVNLSLYTHVLYIMINKLSSYGITGIIVYTILHLIALRVQMIGLNRLFGCSKERLKVIFYIEFAVQLWSWMDLVLSQVGRGLMFNEKLIMQYPLIGGLFI